MIASNQPGFLPSLAILSPSLLLLASCVGPAPRPPVVQAAPVRTVARMPARSAAVAPVAAAPVPVATEWQYRPVAPGSWRYRAEPGGSVAQFGSEVALRCDRSGGRISLTRSGAGQGPITLRTSYGAVSWPAVASGGAAAGAGAQMVAVRAASDTAFDQIAYSRGKIAIEGAGQPMLILPVWAELSRVIEDCRG